MAVAGYSTERLTYRRLVEATLDTIGRLFGERVMSIVDDLDSSGPSVWVRFSGTTDPQLWYYRSLAEVYEVGLGGRLAEAVAAQAERLAAAFGGDSSKL